MHDGDAMKEPVDHLDKPDMPTLLRLMYLLGLIGLCLFPFMMALVFVNTRRMPFIEYMFFQPLQAKHSLLPVPVSLFITLLFVAWTARRDRRGWVISVFAYVELVLGNVIGLSQVNLWSLMAPEVGVSYDDYSSNAIFFSARIALNFLLLIYFFSDGVRNYYGVELPYQRKVLYYSFFAAVLIHIVILFASPPVIRV